MPAKSAKQYGLMQAAAHGHLRGVGPSPEVAREFIDATSRENRSKFARALGGATKINPSSKKKKK